MMYTVQFTGKSEEDLFSILKYITNILKSPTAAKNLLHDIQSKVKILETSPYCCQLVKDQYLSQKGIRFLVVKNYMVFYTIHEDEKTASVIRILYGRRDWKTILEQ